MATNKKYDISYRQGALMSDYFDAVMNAITDFDLFVSGDEQLHYSIIKANSEASQQRYLRELTRRIKQLSSSMFNKRVIQFYTICKTYSIIAEFMIEVVRKKWLNLNFNLEPYDFRNHLIEKLEQTDVLEQTTETTLYRLGQVFFKMLRELGMYKKEKFNTIQIAPQLMQLLYQAGDEWFIDAMLQSEDDKKQMKR